LLIKQMIEVRTVNWGGVLYRGKEEFVGGGSCG
jgi:hypothetical protein